MKKIYIILAFVTVSLTVQAQYKLEFGGILGTSSYLGEMGGKELNARRFIADAQIKRIRSTQGIYVRKKLSKSFMWRTAFTYYRLSGADNLSTNVGRVGRNLSFRNNIFELETQLEWVFYKPKNIARWGGKRVDMQAYLFGGIAGYHHDPVTTYNGKTVKLRPLKTEGVTYKPWQVAVPAGIGMAYIIGKTLKIGLEISYRKVFTDYIDDVSTVYKDPNSFTDPTAKALSNRRGELGAGLDPEIVGDPANYTALNKRGDPKHLDDIFFLQATVGYVIKGKNSFYKSKYRSITGRRGMKKRRVRAKF